MGLDSPAFLQIIWKRLPVVIVLFTSFHKVKFTEVSTLLLLCDVSLKLCPVCAFSNRPTSSSSSFVFFSFSAYGLNPNDDSFLLLEVRRSKRQLFGFSFCFLV